MIGYVENSSRFGMVGVVDLQTLILSEYMTREQFNTMPRFGEPGVDLNAYSFITGASCRLNLATFKKPETTYGRSGGY